MISFFSKKNRTLRWAKKSPLGLHVSRMLHTDSSMLTEMSLSFRNEIENNFYEKVFKIREDGSFGKFRDELAASVLQYAYLQVLCLTESEKQELPLEPTAQQYISGTLHNNLALFLPHNQQVSHLLQKKPPHSKKQLLQACNLNSAINLFWMNGLNLYGIMINDNEEDWFNPFVNSTMIYAEDHYRKKLKQETLLDQARGLKYSFFTNFVRNGGRKPYTEWLEYMGQ